LERIKQEAIPISQKYLTTLGNNAKRLLNLINELMDFRSVENGKMNLKITSGNINEFVILHASDFKEYAFQRKIDFRMILDPALNTPVWFDRQLVEKIIMNLLNNAFRYTTKGSIIIETLIDVSNFESIYPNNYKVNEKEKKSSMFGIVVRDTGIGISEQSIGKIFDRFYMVNDSQGDQHLGSGIGLALVKNLVLLHKGSISIQSKRENGTDILVAFPFSKDEYSDSEFAKVEEKEISYIEKDKYFFEEISRLNSITVEKPDEYFHRETKRILLVEDNSELRLLISETLSTQYEICEAGNGIIATELLEKKEIDLILSDIMMPGKDGITLCREVKDNISTSHIPFIMLTAKGGLDNRIEGIDSGADAYLEKPINFELLFLTIQNLFKQQGRIKEFYAKNFFSDSSELKINQKDNDFMKLLINVIDSKIDQPEMDISYLTTEMSMSRTPLYAKVKTLTGKSIVEFIRHYRMRKAARLLVEENMPIRDVMDRIGIDTQSYFTRVFKQEFGETPTSFVANAKKKQ
jgi:DNA-binding response OmpR family regulator